ncbi:hypothetical protein TWF718_003337 [Orbilia javanica]|uniref:Uncharacterized protein n=1 Tax=Orbilia javanica TaxID=47235 RepID=A0AAN8RIZ2_9PEZI
MIIDASHLFTDPSLNPIYPSQLLILLETINRPLFILFIPSTSDNSPPDPSVNWRSSNSDAYEKVCREFSKGPTPRYLAVLEVGNKNEWTSPNNILKSRYSIKTCPILLRTQLTTLHPSSETGIQTVQFTAFDEPLPHQLRLFKKGDITHLPTNHAIYKTSIYQVQSKDGKKIWKGWEYEFDIASYEHNRAAKKKIARERVRMQEIERVRKLDEEMIEFLREGMGIKLAKKGNRYEVPKKGLAPSIIETEGGEHYLHRVETIASDDQDGEEPVVGKVEVMESDSDYSDDHKGKKKMKNRDEDMESILESGVYKVDFDKRFEVLE